MEKWNNKKCIMLKKNTDSKQAFPNDINKEKSNVN